MFRKFISVLRDLIASLSLLRYEIYEMRKDVTTLHSCSELHDLQKNDSWYIVEVQYEDCTTTSDPLFSLKSVNDFINLVGLVKRPSTINIIRKFDDGR